MSHTVYDEEKQLLHIVSDEKKLRGFVITTVNNEQELQDFQTGVSNNLQLSPVLATDENEAIEFVKKNGKLVINIFNYEFLKLQLDLIENLAVQEKVELIKLDLFNVQDKAVISPEITE